MRSLSVAEVVPVLNSIATGRVSLPSTTVPSIIPLIDALLRYADQSYPAKLILPSKSVPAEAVGDAIVPLEP